MNGQGFVICDKCGRKLAQFTDKGLVILCHRDKAYNLVKWEHIDMLRILIRELDKSTVM